MIVDHWSSQCGHLQDCIHLCMTILKLAAMSTNILLHTPALDSSATNCILTLLICSLTTATYYTLELVQMWCTGRICGAWGASWRCHCRWSLKIQVACHQWCLTTDSMDKIDLISILMSTIATSHQLCFGCYCYLYPVHSPAHGYINTAGKGELEWGRDSHICRVPLGA